MSFSEEIQAVPNIPMNSCSISQSKPRNQGRQSRLDRSSDSMHIRGQTVEHPLGNIKAWMGATHFLTKKLNHISTEMSLHVLAYNLKRVMNLLVTTILIEALVA